MMILFLAKTVVNITVDMFKINKNYIYMHTRIYIYMFYFSRLVNSFMQALAWHLGSKVC